VADGRGASAEVSVGAVPGNNFNLRFMSDVIEKLYGFSTIWFKVNNQGSWSTTWNKVKVTGNGHLGP